MSEVIAPQPSITEHVMAWRKPGQFYRNVTVRSGEREVQISISPTGKSVRVFVDGVEIA